MGLWKVVPLCERQLRDVNPADILDDGLYRKCNTYKSGGGYDRFNSIYQKRFNTTEDFSNQFVVQLYGCPLRCPYCYVTEDGVFGKYTELYTETLIQDFEKSGCGVFHLMGGAPAIYLEQWHEILWDLDILSRKNNRVYPFHSDFLLMEGTYDSDILKELAKYKNSLYAVSIKGATKVDFVKKTAYPNPNSLNWDLLFSNLRLLHDCGINYYLTFTGMSKAEIDSFCLQMKIKFGSTMTADMLKDSFGINLVEYDALK